jgi:hypothetical protein
MRIRINEAITEQTVLLYGDDGKLGEMPLVDALRLASSRSMDLVEEWERSTPPRKAAVVCRLLRIPRPLVWEGGADTDVEQDDEPALDPDLWFTSEHCDGRHFILGNAHTFRGRLSAWCPSKKRHFAVSKSEIVGCSRETTYFVNGFVSGQEPDVPLDEEGDRLRPDSPDYQAWARASELFKLTGSWNDRLRLCDRCGARLLPSNPEARCWFAHSGSETGAEE